MQRRAATSLAAQALREFRDRASLAQRPAGFQALYSQPQARAAASSDRTHSTTSSGEGGTAQHAQAPVASGDTASAGSGPTTDANAKEPEGRLALIFTCNKCNSRAMRSFSKQAYTSGVVIIKCPDCGSRHLIADRLGWFGDSASVETILKEKGQDVRWHETGGTLELSDADAAAWSQAIEGAKADAAAKAG